MKTRTKEQFERIAATDPVAFANSVVDYLKRLRPQPPEIENLLIDGFQRAINVAIETGKALGAAEERKTNPAMRSVGEAVKVGVKYGLEAAYQTASAVYAQETERGSNPHCAFTQAMKALT